jgi:hypothetical protein
MALAREILVARSYLVTIHDVGPLGTRDVSFQHGGSHAETERVSLDSRWLGPLVFGAGSGVGVQEATVVTSGTNRSLSEQDLTIHLHKQLGPAEFEDIEVILREIVAEAQAFLAIAEERFGSPSRRISPMSRFGAVGMSIVSTLGDLNERLGCRGALLAAQREQAALSRVHNAATAGFTTAVRAPWLGGGGAATAAD